MEWIDIRMDCSCIGRALKVPNGWVIEMENPSVFIFIDDLSHEWSPGDTNQWEGIGEELRFYAYLAPKEGVPYFQYHRSKLPHGWLLLHYTPFIGSPLYMVYIPDPRHLWNLEEGK